MRRLMLSLLLAASVVLTGCASVMLVDNQVQSFPQWPAGAPQKGERFAFDRLPSQRSETPSPLQDGLELAVRDALVAWGLQLPQGQDSVRWLVQVSAGGQRLPRAPWEIPWDRPNYSISGGMGFGGRHGGVSLGFAAGPTYQALSQGCARMSRGEGIWYSAGRMFIVDTAAGVNAGGAIGNGDGA